MQTKDPSVTPTNPSKKLVADCIAAFGAEVSYDEKTAAATVSMMVPKGKLESDETNALRAWLSSANNYGLKCDLSNENVAANDNTTRIISIPLLLNTDKIADNANFFEASLALQRCVNMHNQYTSVLQFLESLPSNEREKIKLPPQNKVGTLITAQHDANGIKFLCNEEFQNTNPYTNNSFFSVVQQVSNAELSEYPYMDDNDKVHSDMILAEKNKFMDGFNKLPDKSFPEKKVFLLSLQKLLKDPYWDKLGKRFKLGSFSAFAKTSTSTKFLRQQLDQINVNSNQNDVNTAFDVIKDCMNKKNDEKVSRHPALDALFKSMTDNMNQIDSIKLGVNPQKIFS